MLDADEILSGLDKYELSASFTDIIEEDCIPKAGLKN